MPGAGAYFQEARPLAACAPSAVRPLYACLSTLLVVVVVVVVLLVVVAAVVVVVVVVVLQLHAARGEETSSSLSSRGDWCIVVPFVWPL